MSPRVSTLALAGRVVRAARTRLSWSRVLEAATTGALVGGGLAAAGGFVALAYRPSVESALWLLWLPVAGGAVGAVRGFSGRPDTAVSALAVDRAAGAHEAFTSALTASDAAPMMRELAARYGLTALADRSISDLLPIAAPKRAAPAAVVIALALALAVMGGPPDAEAGSASRASELVRLPAASSDPAAGGGRSGEAPREGSVPVPGTSSDVANRPRVSPDNAHASDVPGLGAAELRQLAEELAARGVAGGEAALAALARGDREAAELALRSALAARGDGSGTEAGAGRESGSESPGARSAPGGWSVGAWPLRYDREVRAWMRRQVAVDRRANPRGDER